MRPILLFLPLILAGCHDNGRTPFESDVQCVRREMPISPQLGFEGADSVCQKYSDDGTLTQLDSHRIPLNLHGAPDLQAAASHDGVPFTP